MFTSDLKECGSISSYNSEPYGVKNTSLFFEKELSVNGFIVGSLYPKVCMIRCVSLLPDS